MISERYLTLTKDAAEKRKKNSVREVYFIALMSLHEYDRSFNSMSHTGTLACSVGRNRQKSNRCRSCPDISSRTVDHNSFVHRDHICLSIQHSHAFPNRQQVITSHPSCFMIGVRHFSFGHCLQNCRTVVSDAKSGFSASAASYSSQVKPLCHWIECR